MKNELEFRRRIHSAVDAYAAPARENAYLMQRILARANEEEPKMKRSCPRRRSC